MSTKIIGFTDPVSGQVPVKIQARNFTGCTRVDVPFDGTAYREVIINLRIDTTLLAAPLKMIWNGPDGITPMSGTVSNNILNISGNSNFTGQNWTDTVNGVIVALGSPWRHNFRIYPQNGLSHGKTWQAEGVSGTVPEFPCYSSGNIANSTDVCSGVSFTWGAAGSGHIDAYGIPISKASSTIMFLGDSLTVGTGGNDPVGAGIVVDTQPSGFRGYILNDNPTLLQSVGTLTTQTVGAVTRGTPLNQIMHQGTGGVDCVYINTNIAATWAANQADYVIYLIGTNQQSEPTSTNSITATINYILTQSPNTKILLMVAMQNTKSTEPLIALYEATWNTNRAAIAASSLATNPSVRIVASPFLKDNEFNAADTLHPSALGYRRLATIWENALKEFLPTITIGS